MIIGLATVLMVSQCKDSPTGQVDTAPVLEGFYMGGDSGNGHLEIGFIRNTSDRTPTGLNDSLIIRNHSRTPPTEWAGTWWTLDHNTLGINEASCGNTAGIYDYEFTYLLRLSAIDDPCSRKPFFSGWWIPTRATDGSLPKSQFANREFKRVKQPDWERW